LPILKSDLRGQAGRELSRILSSDSLILTGPADLLAYSYDATGGRALPEVVVLPGGTDDTARAVRWAAERGMPVVARGAGTNLSGGTVPLAGGMVIGLSRLDKVVSVDTVARRAVVGPGMTNLALQEYLAPLGFAFAPDPASQKVSTLGGNAGENAGGPHCLKYGVTVDHILGLTAVLADGSVVRHGYDGSSPAPTELAVTSALVGSEGTLALITELVVRLEPLPPAVKTILAVYDRLEDAGRSVSEIIARRLLPATLELMDRTTLVVVEESLKLGYPTDAEGALIIEVDGLGAGLDRQVRLIEEICLASGARSVRVARDETERANLWLGRRSAFSALARRSPIYSVQDITVPRNRLVEMMRHVAGVMAQHELEVAIVAHAGDGNLHPVVLYQVATPERLAKVHAANEQLMRLAVEMDGTISGEHGVGSEKLPFLELAVWPETMDLMGRTKQELDPAGILNPRKAVPPLAERQSRAHQTRPRPDGPLTAFAETVSAAVAAGRRLRPCGSGSRRAWLPPGGELLPLAGLRGITDLDESNLTVTARAGTPAAELHAALTEARFWLPPIDHGYEGTVGGDVATGWLVPTGGVLGRIQRWMLGATVLLGNGDLVRLGGRTMKNVAGYNLLHLLAGSRGRLGAITEVTFRLWPLPESDRTLMADIEEWLAAPTAVDRAGRLDQLIRETRPAAVVAVSGEGNRPPRVLVRLAGMREDVEWAGGRWRDELPLAEASADEAAEGWRRWSHPLRADGEDGALRHLTAPVTDATKALQQLASAGGAWSWCIASGAGYRAGDVAESTGITAADLTVGDRGPGSLDSRLVRAFDPVGVFGPERGSA